MDLKKVAKLINRDFGPPFLPAGFVKAKATKRNTLAVSIGHRDVEVNEKMEVVGAGSDMLPEDRWLIKKGEKRCR